MHSTVLVTVAQLSGLVIVPLRSSISAESATSGESNEDYFSQQPLVILAFLALIEYRNRHLRTPFMIETSLPDKIA